ncbi:TetR/AcrR family transcriptional regulator [Methanovulcanius yangii]|uniref:TetR/AcrR family transcriptional regulator n=1 Tax=Methanovulcanius yangii TaxID=1789227 RepID=UPI0029C9D017|nr:TetR/AcrR family transcriptional regulator [Methanovulcanius yangii]
MSRHLSEEKRKALMEAAIDLFSTQGFHATPTKQISDRAGVSAGTLFRYFSTKEELIDSLHTSITAALADAVDEAIRPGTPVEEQIKNVKREVLYWMFKNPKKALFFEQFSSSPNLTEKTTPEAIFGISALDDLYHKAASTGLLAGINREVFLAHFWYPNFMLIHLHAFGRLPGGIEETVEQAVRSMWCGLAKNP